MIDLRSDTMSTPSAPMLESVRHLELGVDTYEEDDSTQELLSYAANLCGMESALLFPTGVMGNLAAVLTHTPKWQEVIVGRLSHILAHEGGGVSTLGGIPLHSVDDRKGIIDADALKSAISNGEFFSSKTGLICLENSHNDSGGIAVREEEFLPIRELADAFNIPIHLDGARLLNTCVKYGVGPESYCRHLDSVMLCLSKGLGAPMGALLVGSREFIEKAKKIRNMLGGALSQPAYIARMGLTALRTGMEQLATDNANAAVLADKLTDLPGLEIRPAAELITNIVYVYLQDGHLDARHFIPAFEQAGIRLLANKSAYRAVVHNGVTAADIEVVVETFKRLIANSRNLNSPNLNSPNL